MLTAGRGVRRERGRDGWQSFMSADRRRGCPALKLTKGGHVVLQVAPRALPSNAARGASSLSHPSQLIAGVGPPYMET